MTGRGSADAVIKCQNSSKIHLFQELKNTTFFR
jgi:hypothetical protein